MPAPSDPTARHLQQRSTRRGLLHSVAWAAPAALVSVTAPALAASTASDSLVFTNTTATEGARSRTIYVNTRVMIREGLRVPDLVVTVTALEDSRETQHVLEPWGSTDIIRHEFPAPHEGSVTIVVVASAPGHRTISARVVFVPPRWWRDAP